MLTAAAGFEALPPGTRIIDVSQAQKPLNWQAVKAAGIVGVMVRATQGVRESQPVGVDTAFVVHMEGALAAGLRVGAYHAYIPHRDPIEQALFFAAVTALFHDRLTLGYAIDAELDYGMDAAVITERLYQLTRAVASGLDTKPIIYTSLNFWNNHVLPTYDAYFGTLPLWVAAWGTDNPKVLRGWQSIWLHQFGKETVDGQEVDMNRVPVVSTKPFTLYTPFENYVVTSRFNDPRNYSYAPTKKQSHEGEDSVDGSGLGVVYCGRAGTVLKVGYDERGYGHYCLIDFGDDWQAWYAHFKEVRVKQGQQVAVFQPLGIAGATGSATGVHCHLTLTNEKLGLDGYVVRKVLNPAPYLVNW